MNQNQIASKNAKKEIKKNANPSDAKKSDASKEIIKINLSKFADQLGKIELKEKRDKETIYIYPEGFSKEMISSEKGKKFRNSLRNRMKTICNNILLYAKMNRMEDLQKSISEFDALYSANYRIRDYSIKSLSSSGDESKLSLMILALSIIKEMKGSK